MCQMFQMFAGAAEGFYQGTIQNAQNDGQYAVQSSQTDNANMLSKDQADNSTKIRDASNSFQAAQASLSDTQRSITNQNRAAAIGSQSNAQQENFARAQDTMVRGSVEQQIASSAELGALRASAGARNVGGGSADIMRSTMAGATARQANDIALKSKQTSFDQVMQSAGVRSNLIESQDYGQTVANLNLQASIPTTYIKPAKMPDLTSNQMALMGAAGGGGFQQFNQSRNQGSTVQYDNSTGGGGVGQTNGYSSNTIINGVNSVGNDWTKSNANSGSKDFNLGNSGSNSDDNSNSGFSFSLSGDI